MRGRERTPNVALSDVSTALAIFSDTAPADGYSERGTSAGLTDSSGTIEVGAGTVLTLLLVNGYSIGVLVL